MRTSTLVSPPTSEDDSLRIRLEGAWEVLDSAAQRYGRAEGTISARRWKKKLRQQPDLLEELSRREGAVRTAMGRAEHLLQRETSSTLSALLERVRTLRAAAQQALSRRLGVKEDLALEDAARQLSAKVLLEIPGELAPGERRLSEGETSPPWLLLYLPVFLLLQSLAPEDVLPNLLMRLGSVLLIAGVYSLFIGRYTLTNRRLLVSPRFGEPVQHQLSNLKPGSIALTPVLRAIRFDGPEPFNLRPTSEAGKLIAALEVARALEGQTDAAPPLEEVAIFPAVDGENVRSQSTGTVVMRPGYAGFFLNSRADEVLAEIAGGPSVTGADLQTAFAHLAQLAPSRFDEVIRSAASRRGFLFERQESTIASTGPLWQALCVKSPQHAFSAKLTWQHLPAAERMVAKWREAKA